MRKKVWIFNHHANSMFFDNGGRHYSFAKYLRREGYEPVIFCSNAEHGTGQLCFDDDRIWHEHINETIDVPFVFIKGRPYIGNGKNRILCMVDYYRNVMKVAKEYSERFGKPDVIIGSQVHPLAVVSAIKIAKKYGVKSIAEIRDLWPESIVAYGVASRNNVLVKMLYELEKWIYVHADKIVFTIGGGELYIKDHKLDKKGIQKVKLNKVRYINNGVDLECFDYNKRNFRIRDCDLDNKDIVKVVYVGSIRQVNNIGKILDVAKQVNSQTKFLIWGKGDEVEKLKRRIVEENISNVVYKGSVEKKYIPYIVSSADVNLMDMQESNDIFRYGISPNKMFEYFAAKKPIVMYQLNAFNPAIETGVGFVADELSDIVEYLNKGECKRNTLDNERFEIACEEYSYKNLTMKYIDIIEEE